MSSISLSYQAFVAEVGFVAVVHVDFMVAVLAVVRFDLGPAVLALAVVLADSTVNLIIVDLLGASLGHNSAGLVDIESDGSIAIAFFTILATLNDGSQLKADWDLHKDPRGELLYKLDRKDVSTRIFAFEDVTGLRLRGRTIRNCPWSTIRYRVRLNQLGRTLLPSKHEPEHFDWERVGDSSDEEEVLTLMLRLVHWHTGEPLPTVPGFAFNFFKDAFSTLQDASDVIEDVVDFPDAAL
ncbi:hypothetical protein M407DRAFT_25685 [Tulasnella calospora MUT 4182]|uniref:Uncharacterized protein n=1 Tax=Tulasnella calospora MUT 4182 TaxID=1051891 RepID=A0A0C3Q6E9_9AGAM|nr:hypothetical protein M407DRAFT_25685 [Tulasnella calospora MUT 4182]